MRKIDIFQHWAQNRIAVILQCVEEKTYLRNHVLFREGDKSNLLYFIKEGEVEVEIVYISEMANVLLVAKNG